MAGDGLPGDTHRARRRWVAIAAAGLLLVGVGAASAGEPGPPARPTDTVTRAVLRPAYQGHYVTPGDLAVLRANGFATASVLNRELVCQGIELYFDTYAERDAYLADYVARFPAEPAYLLGDPCRPFRDSPRYVTGD